MPPVTELPVAPSLPQRLVPPPRVPVETPTRSNLPALIRPSELPTLPPLVTPPEALIMPAPVEGSLVIPTDHIVAPPAAPEIQQIGAVDNTPPAVSASAKGCGGESALGDLVKEKGQKSHSTRAASPEPAKKITPPVAAVVETAPTTRTLTGKVSSWRGSWILRYAEIDAIDEHGGSVVLFGGPELDRIRDGQQITVQGELIPAESRHASARFRVSRIVNQK